MCGFVGFANLKQKVTNEKNIIENMNEQLKKRGPDEEGYFKDEHIELGHRRLVVVDEEHGKQPMSIVHNNIVYTIVYNGQIYNTEEIRKDLKENGFEFEGYSDTEVLIKAFICYGTKILSKLNGIFSFALWNSNTEELFLVRDHFGIKPLFYSVKNNTIIFSSEIKAILAYPDIEAKIDKLGISEILGIGPAHTPGLTPFKNINEVKPAHFIIFNKYGIYEDVYWKLESKTHTDSLDITCQKIRFLLEDSIKKQMVSDMPLCAMLSGGLDSSIITAYVSKIAKQNGKKLETYSVDYLDNDKNFIKSDFQPNSDEFFINIMKSEFETNHNKIIIDTPELVDALEEAMIARDYPGMADVDSSLFLFCKEIKKKNTVAISGECSDEIFAGYPWFFREDSLNSNTFPWSIAIEERQKLLNPVISEKINLKEYIDNRYNESLSNVRVLDTDSKDTKEKRKISYLTMNWFMQTLLDRSDRMAMQNGLEIRVPFCDYRIVEYMWNVPWEIKALNGREKGLLRYAVRDLLPEEIINRKKSPYPKTHNPNYLRAVKKKLYSIIENKKAPIHLLLNKEYILDILNTDGKAFTRPWFGQLMTGPQLMAYIIQVNMWLEKYKIEIEIS